MTTTPKHTPFDAEIEMLFREYKAASPTAKKDKKRQWHMMALADGYRRAQNDYAPLLEAAKAGLPTLEQSFLYLRNESLAHQVVNAARQLRAAIAAVEGRSA